MFLFRATPKNTGCPNKPGNKRRHENRLRFSLVKKVEKDSIKYKLNVL